MIFSNRGSLKNTYIPNSKKFSAVTQRKAFLSGPIFTRCPTTVVTFTGAAKVKAPSFFPRGIVQT